MRVQYGSITHGVANAKGHTCSSVALRWIKDAYCVPFNFIRVGLRLSKSVHGIMEAKHPSFTGSENPHLIKLMLERESRREKEQKLAGNNSNI